MEVGDSSKDKEQRPTKRPRLDSQEPVSDPGLDDDDDLYGSASMQISTPSVSDMQKLDDPSSIHLPASKPKATRIPGLGLLPDFVPNAFGDSTRRFTAYNRRLRRRSDTDEGDYLAPEPVPYSPPSEITHTVAGQKDQQGHSGVGNDVHRRGSPKDDTSAGAVAIVQDETIAEQEELSNRTNADEREESGASVEAATTAQQGIPADQAYQPNSSNDDNGEDHQMSQAGVAMSQEAVIAKPNHGPDHPDHPDRPDLGYTENHLAVEPGNVVADTLFSPDNTSNHPHVEPKNTLFPLQKKGEVEPASSQHEAALDEDSDSSEEEFILGVVQKERKPTHERKTTSQFSDFEPYDLSRRVDLKNEHDSENDVVTTFPPESVRDAGTNSALADTEEHGTTAKTDSSVLGSVQATNDNAGAGRQSDTSATQPSDDDDDDGANSKIDSSFVEAAQANNDDANAEWRFDSSDAQSSDETSDESVSGSEEEEDSDDEEYELLDAEELARILMREDEPDTTGKQDQNAQPRTANEITEAVPDVAHIQLPETTEVVLLGHAERVVEKHLIIRGISSGETQVPASGSLLCLEDKTVVGVVAEPFGRVDDPRYSVAFKSEEEVTDLGIGTGVKVFYVPTQSTYVFTQELQRLKGTDASNIHDEEPAGGEEDFSDDEEERKHKKMLETQRKAKKGLDRQEGNGYRAAQASKEPQAAPGSNYSDELYTPLARPDNLHALPSRPPISSALLPGHSDRGRSQRGYPERGRRGSNRGRTGRNQRGGRGGTLDGRPYPKHRERPRFSSPGTPPDADSNRSSPHRGSRQDNLPPTLEIPNAQQDHNSAPAFNMSSPQTGTSGLGYGNSYYSQPTSSPAAYVSPHPFWQTQNQVSPYGHTYFYPPPAPLPPTTPGGSLPPGAYVNPAFFRNPNQGAPGFGQGQPFALYQPSTSPQQQSRSPQTHVGSREGANANVKSNSAVEEYDPTRPWM